MIKKLLILMLFSLLIVGCKAKGESTMKITVKSISSDYHIYYSLKDISISDEMWGPYYLDSPSESLIITCFTGDKICVGAGSFNHTWGCGARGDISDYNKDTFCEKCRTEKNSSGILKPVVFTLSDENANEDFEEIGDFDILIDEDCTEDADSDSVCDENGETPDTDQDMATDSDAQ